MQPLHGKRRLSTRREQLSPQVCAGGFWPVTPKLELHETGEREGSQGDAQSDSHGNWNEVVRSRDE